MPHVQYAFDFYRDFPTRPNRPERLVFMLFPDRETSNHVSRITKQILHAHCLKGTPLATERLHVSLHHVGDYKRLKAPIVYAARRAGKAVSMRSFEVTCRSIMSFVGAPTRNGRTPRHPLVLIGEGAGLVDLHAMLGGAMARCRLRAAAQFTPHITLLYGPNTMPPQPIEPIRFVVRDFALIHSEVGLSRYHVLDRWSLQE